MGCLDYDSLILPGAAQIGACTPTASFRVWKNAENRQRPNGALLRFHGPRKAGKLMPKDTHLIADRLAPGAREKYIAEWQYVLDGLVDLKREAAIKLDPKLKRCE